MRRVTPAAPVVIAVPDRDFDLTEVVVPWRVLRDAGVPVAFATERGPQGSLPACDPKLIDDPTLRALRLVARPANVALYRELEVAPERQAPIRWADIDPTHHAGLVLPGGHWARGMRQYLEGAALQAAVVALVRANRPVGAICHGGVVLARAVDPATGRSVIDGKRVTALLRSSELTAFWLTRLVLGDYYRTYPETVESEVTRAVGERGAFERGPLPDVFYKPGVPGRGFVVQDGQLVTARWPGDAEAFAQAFLRLVRAQQAECPVSSSGRLPVGPRSG